MRIFRWFSLGMKKALVNYIHTQTVASYPIDKLTLYRLASMTLHRQTETGEQGVPASLGKHWHDGFFQRYPEVQTERTKVLERLRADSTITELLQHWFSLYHEITTQPDMFPELLWSKDESRIQLGVQHTAAFIIDSDVHNRIRKSSQNCESCIVIDCISATGTVLLPIIILGTITNQTKWYSIER